MIVLKQENVLQKHLVIPILRINIGWPLLSPVSCFKGLAGGNQVWLFGHDPKREKKGRHLAGWGQNSALNSRLVE